MSKRYKNENKISESEEQGFRYVIVCASVCGKCV